MIEENVSHLETIKECVEYILNIIESTKPNIPTDVTVINIPAVLDRATAIACNKPDAEDFVYWFQLSCMISDEKRREKYRTQPGLKWAYFPPAVMKHWLKLVDWKFPTGFGSSEASKRANSEAKGLVDSWLVTSYPHTSFTSGFRSQNNRYIVS